MMICGRRFFFVLLFGSLGGWLFLLGLESRYKNGANYSLIEERLYMGGRVRQPPPGTGAVLNLDEAEDAYRCTSPVWEPIRDSAPAPDIDWLRRMVQFIDAQRRDGVTTYVHCLNGVSRSGMVVTAYLMYEKRWTRDQALAFVRSKRPITRPNPAFMELLLKWEAALHEQSGQSRR